MAWQAYQHYQPATTSYPLTYAHATTDYAIQQYHQAWYGYTFQQHHVPQPRPAAPIPHISAVPIQPAAPVLPSTIAAPTTTTTFSSYNPILARDSSSSLNTGSSSGNRGPRRHALKGLFAKEIPKLMYSFGDDKQVATDSVNVMEEILIEYIVDMCQSALTSTRKTRLQIEDIRRALTRAGDEKKLARMEELLFMQEDIKRARKEFNDDEMGGGDNF